jgi:phosphinothricin acetyltransferase
VEPGASSLTSTAKGLASPDTGDHLLVAEVGPGVAGYAFSTAFRPRAAYAQTRETSVYLAPDAVGIGLGTLLYTELLSLLRTDGMHTAVAVVAMPNPASVALHERLGFGLAGTLRKLAASLTGGSTPAGTS